MITERHVAWFCFALFLAIAASTWPALAQEPPKCPNPQEPCRVVYLTQQEEKVLMGPNGVLDTAAQARNLDLGQFVVYFKTRISGSQLIEAPKKDQEQIPGTAPKPVDTPK
jgi:hypothetical protein